MVVYSATKSGFIDYVGHDEISGTDRADALFKYRGELMMTDEENSLEDLEQNDEFKRALDRLYELAARRGISATELLRELMDNPRIKQMLTEKDSAR